MYTVYTYIELRALRFGCVGLGWVGSGWARRRVRSVVSPRMFVDMDIEYVKKCIYTSHCI